MLKQAAMNLGHDLQFASLQFLSLTGAKLYIYCKLTLKFSVLQSFPDSLVGKESTCNAGNPGAMSGLRRFPGEGKGYPL